MNIPLEWCIDNHEDRAVDRPIAGRQRASERLQHNSASITDVVFHFDLDGDGTLDEIESTEDPVTVVSTGSDQEVVGTVGVTITLAE